MYAGPVLRIAADPQDVVEQADLRRFELPVSRQPALQADPLSHALPGDELDVALEHRMIEWLAVFPADEIRSERLEDVLERKRARPLTYGVRDSDVASEGVTHQNIIGV